MSDPSKPADGGKKPLDLKSRLGLKTQAAAAPAPAPVTSGAQLPPPPAGPVLPPPPSPKVEGPTAETIEEARRRAEELAAAAGPAAEEFSIGGAPDRTPVPAVGGGVQVEYVDVGAKELSPEVRKKNRMVLIGAVVVAALVAFFLGRALSSSDALNALKENMILEAKEKLRTFETYQPAFAQMSQLTADLKAFNDEAAAVEAGKKEMVELEEPLGVLVGKVKAFVDAKAYVDPALVVGGQVYNGEVVASVLNFALRTQAAYQQASSLLEEAQTLVAMWRPVPEEAQKRLVLADVEDHQHPEFGAVPFGKGRLVKNVGAPAKIDLTSPDGRVVGSEFQQMVLLEGEKEPIQVKTSQVVQTDLGPFFTENLNATKSVSLGRLAELTGRLQKMLEACNPGPVENTIQEFLVKAGVDPDNASAAEAPPAE